MVLMEFADVVMFFFFNDTATTEIYTLSLHDALPICYGSGMTCWRRLRDWNAAGVWEQLHQAMLTRLREHDQIDWSRASIDGSSVPSPRGARKRAQTPRTEASRSEEHTSELQSQSNLVCRLLLEK